MKQGTQDLWVTESSPRRQTAVSVAMLAVGLVLAYGFRGFHGPGISNSMAGFLLGMLLIAIAAASLLSAGKQVITVDPQRRQIVVSGQNRFSSGKRVILFKDVARLRVGRFGDASDGIESFHVSVILKQGGSVPLFFGFYEGQYDRAVAQARCDRLAAYLQL
jgi:hypothetical protein